MKTDEPNTGTQLRPGRAPTNLQEFRSYVKDWVRSNLEQEEAPSNLEFGGQTKQETQVVKSQAIQATLYQAGLAGIRYPQRYGGQGLSAEHQAIFIEETLAFNMPTLFRVTFAIIGPTLLDFGTEEQKQRYIPEMLSGGSIWVQLLSESESGSDMAGAHTRAMRDGDIYLLNGSKIWTTGARSARYGLLLARTNPAATKHRGLSMFIVPLEAAGVTITPIRLSTGSSEFCQEFFEDVSLPVENLLGDENDGWTVATRLLYHERQMVGGTGLGDIPVHSAPPAGDTYRVIDIARRVGMLDDPVTRQLVGESLAFKLIFPMAAERIGEQLRLELIPGPGAALLKLLGSELSYRDDLLSMRIAGETAAVWTDVEDQNDYPHSDPPGQTWLVARTMTISGGTTEMQLNQISERVLGLPRETTPDKNVAFADIQRGTR